MIKHRLSGRSTRALVAIAWLLSIAFTAWIAAELMLRLTQPQGLAADFQSVTDPRVAAQRLATRAPIASSHSERQAPQSAIWVSEGFELVGVATGFGTDQGFALIKPTGGKVGAFVIGEQIVPGVVLAALHASHVDIERAGVREIVQLQRTPLAGGVAPVVINPGNPALPDPANLR